MPGMCAGYPAGKRDAHHFINRGSVPATYLEIGNRIDGDNAFYPDDDLMWCDDGAGEYGAHKDGRALSRMNAGACRRRAGPCAASIEPTSTRYAGAS